MMGEGRAGGLGWWSSRSSETLKEFRGSFARKPAKTFARVQSLKLGRNEQRFEEAVNVTADS